MNTYLVVIPILIIFTIPTAVTANTYKSYVDYDIGFYKITDITTLKPVKYDNRTLIINQGDSLLWVNDADDKSLTIISKESLFDAKYSFLRYYNNKFSYTFDTYGIYEFYIQENKRFRQTIIVNKTIDEEVLMETINTTPTPTSIINITPVSTAVANKTPTPTTVINTTPVQKTIIDIFPIPTKIVTNNRTKNHTNQNQTLVLNDTDVQKLNSNISGILTLLRIITILLVLIFIVNIISMLRN